MTIIKPLTEIGFDELYAAFAGAFKDYARSWNRDEFRKLLHRRGYVSELSFGAFDGDRLVSFTLNGIGKFNGKHTAYDAGTGTITTHRGQGLATKIFNYALPILKQNGIQQYLLEVLTQNTRAISVYSKLGFIVTRELNVFIGNKQGLPAGAGKLPSGIEIRETGFSEKEEMEAMWDFQPSWQNNMAAVSKKEDDFRFIGAYREGQLKGYGIIEIASGDIPQLAVATGERRKGIGSSILSELIKSSRSDTIRIINTDKAFNTLDLFLENKGIPQWGSQYEMIMAIE